MKFFSLAVLAVLFCAVVVFGAPTSETDDSNPTTESDDSNNLNLSDADKNVEAFQKSIKCVDGVFGGLVEEHKELEKHHLKFKEYLKETNLKLDECKKIEDPVSQEECLTAAEIKMAVENFADVMDDLEKENEETARNLEKLIVAKCLGQL